MNFIVSLAGRYISNCPLVASVILTVGIAIGASSLGLCFIAHLPTNPVKSTGVSLRFTLSDTVIGTLQSAPLYIARPEQRVIFTSTGDSLLI